MKLSITWLTAVILGTARLAAAHDVRGEVVLLDIGERAVDVEARVSVQQLAIARGTPPGGDPGAMVIADQAALRARAERAIGAHTTDGRAFSAAAGAVALARDGDGDVVVFHVHLVAPPGASARWFALRDDLVLDRVTTANVYAFLRSDPQRGVVDGPPTLLGYLHYQQRELVVDRRGGSLARAFASVFALGARHIASGTDHLMFLLVLLVPAPLLVDRVSRRRRWGRRRDTRSALAATARIVSAFTLGHSLTLLIGAVHGAVLPAAVVESLIAVSILVTAVHALRPVFPRREAVIAAAFGLVHGLAFASTLTGVGVDRVSLAIGVLGFNLGVEAMQLAIVLLAVPWLLALARHPIYRPLRWLAAASAALAAIAWLAERAASLHTPVPALVERAAGHAGWALVALALTAIGLEIASARRGGWRRRLPLTSA